jgi:N-dimethylarginine dimethylaminohydrolase
MNAAVTSPLRLNQTTEYGRLRTVVWGPIVPTPMGFGAAIDSLSAEAKEAMLANNSMSPFELTRAAEQHLGFRRAMEAAGAQIEEVDILGEMYSQFGTRDVGFVVDDVFVVSRFVAPSRMRETVGLRRLLRRMAKVAWLDTGFIEGGDVMLHDGAVLVGMSEASNEQGVEALAYALETHGINRKVIPIHFSQRGVVHLDCKLMIVDEGLAVIHREGLSAESLKLLEGSLDLIPATTEEARAVRVNMLPIGDKRVIMAKGGDRIANELSRRGMRPIEVDYDEVSKVGGSLRCTSLPLLRD